MFNSHRGMRVPFVSYMNRLFCLTVLLLRVITKCYNFKQTVFVWWNFATLCSVFGSLKNPSVMEYIPSIRCSSDTEIYNILSKNIMVLFVSFICVKYRSTDREHWVKSVNRC